VKFSKLMAFLVVGLCFLVFTEQVTALSDEDYLMLSRPDICVKDIHVSKPTQWQRMTGLIYFLKEHGKL